MNAGQLNAADVMRPIARADLALTRWRASWRLRRDYRPRALAYPSYGSTSWVRVLGRVLLAKLDGEQLEVDRSASSRGWRLFTSVPVENAEVEVEIAGVKHRVRANASGVIDAAVEQSLTPGWHAVKISPVEGPEVESVPVQSAVADILIVGDDQQFGVISDIDDTVMVTSLPKPLHAAWNTFVANEQTRDATPGMPVLYERLSRQSLSREGGGAADQQPVFFYLSTGAWNVAPALTRFLSRNLYPRGPLLLTDWGPTKDRWFRSGKDHKRENLTRWAKEFPNIRWLLVGDDGQHDAMLYREFAQTHPDRVAAVCIRQLGPGEAVLAAKPKATRTQSDAESPVPWIYSPDGAGLAKQLQQLGILS